METVEALELERELTLDGGVTKAVWRAPGPKGLRLRDEPVYHDPGREGLRDGRLGVDVEEVVPRDKLDDTVELLAIGWPQEVLDAKDGARSTGRVTGPFTGF